MTAAGFMFASKGEIDGWLLLTTLSAMALVIAGACVFNNYIDRNIDAKMKRTQTRAIVSGRVSGRQALTFATALSVLGLAIIAIYINYITVLLGIIAFVDYVIIYGIAKRRTVLSTLVGTVAGALPPAAGYTAVTGRFDAAALLLFLVMVFWQMAHFYAISIFRHGDYKAAGLPVMAVSRGMETTRRHIIGFIVAFAISAPLFTLLGYTGVLYLLFAAGLGMFWLWKSLATFKLPDGRWAGKVFGSSLLVLVLWAGVLVLGPLLP